MLSLTDDFLAALRVHNFQIEDVRHALPHADVQVCNLRSVQSIHMAVVHCSGVTVPDAPGTTYAQLVEYAKYHMAKNWATAEDHGGRVQPEYGDGIMYTLALGRDGTAYCCRDIDRAVWAQRMANRTALSILLPGNFDQEPTAVQKVRLLDLLDLLFGGQTPLKLDYHAVYGHGELTSYGNDTRCPGPELTKFAVWYRGHSLTPGA